MSDTVLVGHFVGWSGPFVGYLNSFRCSFGWCLCWSVSVKPDTPFVVKKRVTQITSAWLHGLRLHENLITKVSADGRV